MEKFGYVSGANESNNHKPPSPLDKNGSEFFLKTAELSLDALYRQMDALREQGNKSLLLAKQTQINEMERKIRELKEQMGH